MQRFHKIGILLTGSPADESALGYAARIAALANPTRILCVCEEQLHGQPTGIDPAAIEQQFRTKLGDRAGVAEFRTSQGHGLTDILRAARDEELDLLVKGRRLPANELSNASAARLARKAPCTTLLVPTQTHVHLSRLLVPVDFSEHSRMALQLALEIGRSTQQDGKQTQVLAMSTYAVNYGYAKTGMTMTAAADKIAVATQQQFDKFLQDFDTSGIEFDTFMLCTGRTSRGVHEVATARKLDIIVLGSRGLTSSAAAVLGSTTEDIIMGAALPVLVVKKKGETVGLLNALLDQVTK